EQVRVVSNVLIAARDELVGVAAAWCRTQKIIYRGSARRQREVGIPHLGGGRAEFRGGNYVVRVRRALQRCRIDAVWVVELIGGVSGSVFVLTNTAYESRDAECGEISLA